MRKHVFHYTWDMTGSFLKLDGVYRLVNETATHLQIKRWYGKPWYPKNEYWRIEEAHPGSGGNEDE